MSGIRLISAFVFAVAMLSVLLLCAWFLNIKRLEGSVVSFLEKELGADMSFEAVSTRINFPDISVTFSQPHIQINSKRDEFIAFSSDSLQIHTDLAGRKQIEVFIPQQSQLKLSSTDKSVQYDLIIGQGRWSFYPRSEREAVVDIQRLKLLLPNAETPFFGASYLNLSRQANGKSWEVVLNDLMTSKPFAWPMFLDGFKMTWSTPVEYDVDTLKMFYTLFSGKNERVYEDILEEVEAYKNLDVALDVSSFRVEKGHNIWSFYGDVGVGAQNTLEGKLKATTNNLLPWLDELQKGRWLSPVKVSFLRILERIERESSTPSINIDMTLKGGRMFVNGYNLGSIQNIPAMIGAEAKR